MIKKYYLIILSLLCWSVFSTSVQAIDASFNCDSNNNGKVSITKELNQTVGSISTCFLPAESYEITLDAIALCTANPETEYDAGRNIDDTCTYVLNPTDDQVTVNMSNSSSTSFPAVLPGVGTYTHALLVSSKFYTIKAEVEFENGTAVASNDARNGQGAGTHCGPPLQAQGNYSVSTFYDAASFSMGQTLANCYNGTRGANKNSGTLNTDTLMPNTFSNSVAGLGLLLDSEYNLAEDESDTALFLQPYEFATPVTVDTDTVSMNYKFSTDQAHRIWYATASVGVIVVYMSYLGDFNLVVEAQ